MQQPRRIDAIRVPVQRHRFDAAAVAAHRGGPDVCACGGGCPRCTGGDADATIAALDDGLHDELEREADRVADAVVPGINPPTARAAAAAEVVWAAPAVTGIFAGGGSALDPTVHDLALSRLNRDIGAVRVHTDAAAAETADRLEANAYTLGRDIGFAAGAYRPDTVAGRHLIVHELAHVAQQAGGAPRLQLQKRGSSRFEERVGSWGTVGGSGIWSGSVRRLEFGDKKVLIHEGVGPILYDENACAVRLPTTVFFRDATVADVPALRDAPLPAAAPKPLPAASFESLARRFLNAANTQLNGWYSVRFNGCPDNRCHGKAMPIRVEVTRSSDAGAATYQVVLANMEGRSFARRDPSGAQGLVVLFGSGISDWTLGHEGGHMGLGLGDEYEEPGYPLERVREGDWSLMDNQLRYQEWSMLHRRHFAHVPAFLNEVREGCDAGLVELPRPQILETRLSFGLGYANLSGEGGGYFSLGYDVDVPLDRLRSTQASIGLRGTAMAGLGDRVQSAVLLGMRLGLRHTRHRSAGGLSAQLFGELGRGWFDPGLGAATETGAYGEIGAELGYTGRFDTGWLEQLQIGLEASAGSRIGTSGWIGEPPKAEDMRWVRLGFTMVLRHR